MIYTLHYGIHPKPSLRSCMEIEPDFARLLADTPHLIQTDESCRSIWTHEDHEANVKLLFLVQLKVEYDAPFIANAPISVEFFDQWWTIHRYDEAIDEQDVLDNLSPEHSAQLVPTGRQGVDANFRETAMREQQTTLPTESDKQRIWWEGDVVGWVEQSTWGPQHLQGRWSRTTNPKGREFSKLVQDGVAYSVIVDGSNYLRGTMVKNGDTVTITVRVAPAT